ncbi:hypothetical protein OH76DRAFT_1423701 [Lentinus brumalis]|uniref:Uncharacterized protein n=1 Tax=Lentinus brumalis TaxID=2498619 RepID=A0A371CJI1_9APHY|nr:hypothetical protein OH76DRAFT_1423701 [Polyporus brumalis]
MLPTSGTLETEYEENNVFLSASESPDYTPPPTLVASPYVYHRDHHAGSGQTIINITVNATTAPVTVQSGNVPRSPPPMHVPTTPVRRRAIAADTATSPRSARGSRVHAGYNTPPSTRSISTRRANYRPDYDAPPSPMSPTPRPTLSRPATRTDSEAASRRMREIERALEEFRLEQTLGQAAGHTRMSAEPVTEGNVQSYVLTHFVKKHIDPPELGRLKWYIAIVAVKVGILKHYSEMTHYLAVSHASHQKTSSRDEAERLYYACKAKGLIRVVKQ